MKANVQLEGETLREIVDLFANQGWSLTRLARRYKVWQPRLRAALVAQGLEMRVSLTKAEVQDAMANDFVMSGLDIEAICRKHGGVTEKVMRRIVKERGLVRQTPVKMSTALERRDGRKVYDHWIHRYGQEEADKRDAAFKALCSKRCTGRGNPMYGRPSPQGSGNGWKGWYKGQFFRSLRELCFMMDVLDKVDGWESGEGKEYAIPYVDPLGATRIYYPDYVVVSTCTMYEIKPLRLQTTPSVMCKAAAARVRCAELGWEYVMVDQELDAAAIRGAYERGDVKWTEKTLPRYRAYYEA